jgi:hypothetical protein
VLRTKTIPIAKVLLHNHGVEEASWEAENDMRKLEISLSICRTSTFKHCQLGLMGGTRSFKRLPSMDLVKMKVIFLFSLGL